MGKKAKEHRAKVAKRNKKMSQERYSMQNTLNKMMQRITEEKQNEELQVKLGNENIPFEVETKPLNTGIKGFEFEGNVSFKEEHPEMLETTEVTPEIVDLKQDNEQ